VVVGLVYVREPKIQGLVYTILADPLG
jgi:hypothetical protein